MMNATKWTWCGLVAAGLVLTAVTAMRKGEPAGTVGEKVELVASAAPAIKPTAAIQAGAKPAQTRSDPIHAVESAVQKTRAGGAGEDEVYRLRAAALSTQTIALLTEREEAEKRWLLRLTAWRAERALLNQADSAALQALRDRLFSVDEQTRLDANEAVDSPKLILR